jgi:NTP pyrophosphatase (non-canonical NTP hydrolase)
MENSLKRIPFALAMGVVKKSINELRPLIISWAKERDLLKEENAPKQKLKLIEELGELARAILKNDIDNQKDSVGDIFVVLVILAEQVKHKLYFDNEERDLKDVNFFINSLCDFAKEGSNLWYSLHHVQGVCRVLNLDMTKCCNLAWNEIKDRKGITVGGTFIKNN